MNYIPPIPYKGNPFTLVVSTDKHLPAHYLKACDELALLIKERKPTHLMDMGDAIDNKEISRFSQHKIIMEFIENGGKTMPQVWTECIELHNSFERYAPKDCKRHLIWGNHCIRVRSQLVQSMHLYGENYDPLVEAWKKSRFKIKHYIDYPNNDVSLQSVTGAITEIPIIFSHRGKGTGLNHAKATWTADYKLFCSRIYGHSHDPQFFTGTMSINRQSRDNRFAFALGAMCDRSNDKFFGFCDYRARSQWEPTVLVITGAKGLLNFEEIRLSIPELSHKQGIVL